MSFSFTYSETKTFTITHAKHLAAKVATDLKRMQRFYGAPSDLAIARFEEEIIQFLKAGFLDKVIYGFKRNGKWIEPTLIYVSTDFEYESRNDDPGKVFPGADTEGASFYSYLTYSIAWDNATENEREIFRQRLPFQRTGAAEPGIDGYVSSDKTYSSGGRSLERKSVRRYK